jgi:hypothetical protein
METHSGQKDYNMVLKVIPGLGQIQVDLPRELQVGKWGISVNDLRFYIYSLSFAEAEPVSSITNTRRDKMNDLINSFIRVHGHSITLNTSLPSTALNSFGQPAPALAIAFMKFLGTFESNAGVFEYTTNKEELLEKPVAYFNGASFITISITTDGGSFLPVQSNGTDNTITAGGSIFSCSPVYVHLKFFKVV